MLDLKFIRNNKEIVEKAIKDKKMSINLDEILALDEEKRNLQIKIDELRTQRKKLSNDKDSIQKAKTIKKMLKDLEPQLVEISERLLELCYFVPNIPSEDTPIGMSEEDNKVIEQWGKLPKFDFKLKSHIELGKTLDIIDLERGVKVSGFRGYYLKNEGAMLHMAVLQFAFDKMIKKGFTPMIVPTLVGKDALIGSGHFPFGKEEIYQIANPGKLSDGSKIAEPKYLVGTAEPSLLAYRSNEILSEEELPLRLCGFSPCYRSEVGSYGKDTKGLYRIHEFAKIEQVIICKNDLKESEKWFEHLRENAQEVLKDLDLPHQVIKICTADMGAGKYKMYDIETWMPSLDKYGETHSNSHLTDWQTRRLNIKIKDSSGNKYYPYALNNTAIASPRILIAILENYQQKDGSVKIPAVLQKYMGISEIKAKQNTKR